MTRSRSRTTVLPEQGDLRSRPISRTPGDQDIGLLLALLWPCATPTRHAVSLTRDHSLPDRKLFCRFHIDGAWGRRGHTQPSRFSDSLPSQCWGLIIRLFVYLGSSDGSVEIKHPVTPPTLGALHSSQKCRQSYGVAFIYISWLKLFSRMQVE